MPAVPFYTFWVVSFISLYLWAGYHISKEGSANLFVENRETQGTHSNIKVPTGTKNCSSEWCHRRTISCSTKNLSDQGSLTNHFIKRFFKEPTKDHFWSLKKKRFSKEQFSTGFSITASPEYPKYCYVIVTFMYSFIRICACKHMI